MSPTTLVRNTVGGAARRVTSHLNTTAETIITKTTVHVTAAAAGAAGRACSPAETLAAAMAVKEGTTRKRLAGMVPMREFIAVPMVTATGRMSKANIRTRAGIMRIAAIPAANPAAITGAIPTATGQTGDRTLMKPVTAAAITWNPSADITTNQNIPAMRPGAGGKNPPMKFRPGWATKRPPAGGKGTTFTPAIIADTARAITNARMNASRKTSTTA